MTSYRRAQKMFIAQRRARVSELYVSGWTQKRIAAELKVSEFTVSEDIHALIAGRRQEASTNMATHIAIMLKKLDADEARALEAYEQSCKVKRIATATRRMHPHPGETITLASATEIERPEGDPRFLMLVLKCIEARCKLLGLYSARTVEPVIEQPQSFAAFVAMHHENQKRNGSNGSTSTAARLATVQPNPNRLP